MPSSLAKRAWDYFAKIIEEKGGTVPPEPNPSLGEVNAENWKKAWLPLWTEVARVFGADNPGQVAEDCWVKFMMEPMPTSMPKVVAYLESFAADRANDA